MPRYPEVTLLVTEENFENAVPGDMCHCTIGQSVHDALPQIMEACGLATVDGTSISVNPADANGAPCVGVSFKGERADGGEVSVRFLLEDAAAFKVAYTTDNKSTAQMRRRAAKTPYVLRASELKFRRSRVGQTANGGRDIQRFTPEGHIKALATYATRAFDTPEEALAQVEAKVAAKKADKSLPYKLTPKLKRFMAEAVSDSYQAKGAYTPRQAPIKIHKNRRFYA